MLFIIEILLSFFRIVILLCGVLITFFFGDTLYITINRFLSSFYIPCLEIISYIIAFVPVIALFYGIHVQKFFWQRSKKYNQKVFLISYAIGILLALIPTDTFTSVSTGQACVAPVDLLAKITYAIATGVITSLFAYIGMDIGVSLKHTSKNFRFLPTSTKKSKAKKVRRK